MKNANVTHKITQGMYVLTAGNGGCVVDAVAQVSGGDNPLVSVAVMKKNLTNELVKKNGKFALSVLGMNVDPQIIKDFGFRSGRDADKYAGADLGEAAGVKYLNGAIAYMVCEVVDTVENDTHTLFIGRTIEGDILKDESPMSYGYYQEHKNDLMQVKTEKGKTAWVCTICGYVYYGETLPDNYVCPICGVGPELFEIQK